MKGWKWLISNLRQSVKVSRPPWQHIRRLIPGSWRAELRARPRTPSEGEQSVSDFPPWCDSGQGPGRGDMGWGHLGECPQESGHSSCAWAFWVAELASSSQWCMNSLLEAQKASPGKPAYICFRTSSPGHQKLGSDHTRNNTTATRDVLGLQERGWRSFWVLTIYSGRCQKHRYGTASRSNKAVG